MLVEDLNLKNYLIHQYKKVNGYRLYGKAMPNNLKIHLKVQVCHPKNTKTNGK